LARYKLCKNDHITRPSDAGVPRRVFYSSSRPRLALQRDHSSKCQNNLVGRNV